MGGGHFGVRTSALAREPSTVRARVTAGAAFEATMEHLNRYVAKKHLPKKLRTELRDYFGMARMIHRDAEVTRQARPAQMRRRGCCLAAAD